MASPVVGPTRREKALAQILVYLGAHPGKVSPGRLEQAVKVLAGKPIGLPPHVTHAFRLPPGVNVIHDSVCIAHDGTIALVCSAVGDQKRGVRTWTATSGLSEPIDNTDNLLYPHFPEGSNKLAFVYTDAEAEHFGVRWGDWEFDLDLTPIEAPTFWTAGCSKWCAVSFDPGNDRSDDRQQFVRVFCQSEEHRRLVFEEDVLWAKDERTVLKVARSDNTPAIVHRCSDYKEVLFGRQVIKLRNEDRIIPNSLFLDDDGVLHVSTTDGNYLNSHTPNGMGGNGFCRNDKIFAKDGRTFWVHSDDGKTLTLREHSASNRRLPHKRILSVEDIVVLPNGVAIIGHEADGNQARPVVWFSEDGVESLVTPAVTTRHIPIYRRLHDGLTMWAGGSSDIFSWSRMPPYSISGVGTFPLYSDFDRLTEVDGHAVMSWFVVDNTFHVVRYELPA